MFEMSETRLPEKESTTQKCVSCSNYLKPEQIYRCKSCESPNAVDERTDREIFCDMCIVHLHYRKHHDIIDYRSYEPPICPTHKFICVFFCETCQLIFCRLCTENHFSHNVTLIDPKGKEVRKKIFESLSENEMLAKPLRHNEFALKECCSAIEPFFESLNADNLSSTLCDTYTRVIQKKSDQWRKVLLGHKPTSFSEDLPCRKDLSAATQLVKSVDEKTCELRGMLSMSDGNCVTSYLKQQTTMSSNNEQNSAVKKHIYVKKGKSLETIAEDSVFKFIKEIEVPSLQYITIKKIIFRRTRLTEKETLFKHVEAKFRKFSTDDDYTSSGVFNLKLSPENVAFSILQKESNESWKGKSLMIYMPKVSTVHRHKNFALLWKNNCGFDFVDLQTGAKDSFFRGTIRADCLCFFYSETVEFNLLYFIEENSQLLFSTWNLISRNFKELPKQLKCLKKPKIASCSKDFIVSVTDESCLYVYGLKCAENMLIIQPYELGVFQIDNLCFVENIVGIFDYKAQVVLTLKLEYTSSNEAVEWSIVEVKKMVLPNDNPITFCGYFGNSNRVYAVAGNEFYL